MHISMLLFYYRIFSPLLASQNPNNIEPISYLQFFFFEFFLQ